MSDARNTTPEQGSAAAPGLLYRNAAIADYDPPQTLMLRAGLTY